MIFRTVRQRHGSPANPSPSPSDPTSSCDPLTRPVQTVNQVGWYFCRAAGYGEFSTQISPRVKAFWRSNATLVRMAVNAGISCDLLGLEEDTGDNTLPLGAASGDMLNSAQVNVNIMRAYVSLNYMLSYYHRWYHPCHHPSHLFHSVLLQLLSLYSP